MKEQVFLLHWLLSGSHLHLHLLRPFLPIHPDQPEAHQLRSVRHHVTRRGIGGIILRPDHDPGLDLDLDLQGLELGRRVE